MKVSIERDVMTRGVDIIFRIDENDFREWISTRYPGAPQWEVTPFLVNASSSIGELLHLLQLYFLEKYSTSVQRVDVKVLDPPRGLPSPAAAPHFSPSPHHGT